MFIKFKLHKEPKIYIKIYIVIKNLEKYFSENSFIVRLK